MMKLCAVSLNDETFTAKPGERILDAALVSGVDLAHDCRSGKCGTCLVHVLDGHTLGGESTTPGMVHACQAIVVSDLRLAADTLPQVREVGAVVSYVAALTRDVIEVTIEVEDQLDWLPGQYVNVRFEGFPARAFSPTVALDGADQPGTFRLHIKRLLQGAVSAEIGRRIRPGHPVTIEGPFGSAFLRPGLPNRLVLFSGGTGFAPIWSIADAALRESAGRHMVVVAGVGSIHTLYMATALERMSRCPNVVITPVAAEPQNLSPLVRTGWPQDFGSIIGPGDIVHAAGAPDMVEAIGRHAAAAGAPFHADPFTPGTPEKSSGLAKAVQRLGRAASRWEQQVPGVAPQFATRGR